ncbi:MAG: cupin domain-containing protein [Polyangia bacterium]|jgi:quercetin dioxygenase-like cupin family protein|nr:cupin domain-containing protein [Polyangia bacterium]
MTAQTRDQAALPHSKAISLGGVLQVVPGAVVSRTLLKRETGNITLFSFGEGQGLSEHTAPFDAFIQVVEGEVKLTIGGETVGASSGDVVVMPAGVPHAVEATSPLKMLLVMIRDPSPKT